RAIHGGARSRHRRDRPAGRGVAVGGGSRHGGRTGVTEPVALAVVGCGRIAGTHLQALEGFRDARLVGVADVNEPAAVAAAESFGVRAYRDYRDLLEAEAPDAVVVCTPPATHPEISLHALARGVHVLCEKPFAVDWP